MDLINNFIHWTKNIEAIECYRLCLYFDPLKVSIDEIKHRVIENLHLIEDIKLREAMINGQIQYEKREVDGRYFVNFDDEVITAKEILSSFELARTIIPRIHRDFLMCKIRMINSPSGLTKKLVSIPNLYIAMIDNPRNASWENTYKLSRYKYIGGLQNIHYSDHFGAMVHDISDRPGRYSTNPYFKFSGAAEYWFGEAYFQFTPKETLLQFNYAKEIQELENGVIYIKLFDLKDYWLDESQEKIRQLRDFLKVQEMETPNHKITQLKLRPSLWSKIKRKFTE